MVRSPKFNPTLAIGLLLTLLLAACGANLPAEMAPNPAQAATGGGQSASTPAKTETRVFRDYAGHEVTIPTHPQRIVVNQFMGHLLAVGVKPVGATSAQLSQFEKSSFLKPLGLSAGVEDLGNLLSPEKALSMNPDLIILQ